eukprot:3699476-Rhodomonas_salina.7
MSSTNQRARPCPVLTSRMVLPARVLSVPGASELRWDPSYCLTSSLCHPQYWYMSAMHCPGMVLGLGAAGALLERRSTRSVPGGLFYQENDQIYAPSFSVQFEEKKSGVVRVAGVRCAVAHLLCDALSASCPVVGNCCTVPITDVAYRATRTDISHSQLEIARAGVYSASGAPYPLPPTRPTRYPSLTYIMCFFSVPGMGTLPRGW